MKDPFVFLKNIKRKYLACLLSLGFFFAAPMARAYLPDLVVTSVTMVPSEPVAGENVLFKAKITNIGRGSTPSGVVTGVLFSVDGVSMTWSDTYQSSIKPGTSVELTANGGPNGVAYWRATSGTHSIDAWVNDVLRFREKNTTNNHKTISITIAGTPPPSPAPAPAPAPSPTPQPSAFNVKSYGAMCDWNGRSGTDDTRAVQAAIDAASLAGGGTVTFPSGGCVASNLNGKSKVSYQGAGMSSSQLVQKPGSSGALIYLDSNSGIASSNLTDISFSDMTLLNNDGTFSEFIHLVNLAGVTRAVFDRVQFKGFRGDGLYISGGDGGSTSVRHNQNITIRNSVFDGVNNQNRNAISIIDCDVCLIESNQFKNTSLQSMPGPIDMEPNFPFQIVCDITIQKNTFNKNGGGRLIGFWTPSFAAETPYANFYIRENYFAADNTTDSAAFTFLSGETLSSSLTPMNIVFEGNTVLSSAEGVTADFVKGIRIINNRFSGTSISELGNSTVAELSIMDAEVSGNTFDGCSNSVGILLIGSATNIQIHHNTLTPQAAHNTAITLLGSGVTTKSSYISIHDNNFVKGSSMLSKSVWVQNHQLNKPTNQYYGNQEAGGPFANNFYP